ncbi:RNA polymerase sigma factor [Mesorhizobium sp. BAC0120]|uniref:RNA polymerase sigma factor n=1 Tax=Mesorhizobium sp. BAC0120 TaxID=3090670 RepID=UPI00298CBCBA|nr:RNA polymerase sigma factor [Mesorhizobium sp. BAC0120]MDW6022267.1 RNA polymerase sigma factor [Mesorhizobium sp. BAC0120]
MTADDTHRAIEAVWRIEQAKLIAGLTRIVRDVGIAEELAQDALIAALKHWPANGIPDRPGAWLMAVAKNLAINQLQRKKRLDRKLEEIGHESQEAVIQDLDAALDDVVGDDLLSLIFIACHPILEREARAALTLRLLGGLTTAEIARAFLAAEPTIQQRIVRAKRKLAQARVPFEVPHKEELGQRLSSVLEIIYLIFNEGYAATAGEDWMRPRLCDEALRLARILVGLAGEEPEVHGLVALMEIQSSRFAARIGPSGEPVLLFDQNRARWDQARIRRGLAALGRAENKAEALGRLPGPYTLQAAITACHAVARTPEETDWRRIVALYDELAETTPSPVVEMNRAVAVAFAAGPEAGLELIDQLVVEPALANYHLLPGIRGDLLVKLGRYREAQIEFERAAGLTRNARERALLLDRARECARNAEIPS